MGDSREEGNLCSVCESRPNHAGSLQCAHSFCHTCFNKFVAGSLEELNHHLRCSICGENSIINNETRGEQVHERFGRDSFPKLLDPRGLALAKSREYVIPDAAAKRVFIFSNEGHIISDFAHTYGWKLQHGVIVTSDGLIVLPFKHGPYTCLVFYTMEGDFRKSIYLDATSEVSGLTKDSDENFIVADCTNNQLIFVDPARGVTNKWKLKALDGEQTPRPRGVVVNSNNEVLITDDANHCVRIYEKNGQLRKTIGEYGNRPTQFATPTGIAVHDDNSIIVTDTGNNRVQYLSGYHGDFIQFIARYNIGSDVYIAPRFAAGLPGGKVAVLLGKSRGLPAGEVRLYKTGGIW